MERSSKNAADRDAPHCQTGARQTPHTLRHARSRSEKSDLLRGQASRRVTRWSHQPYPGSNHERSSPDFTITTIFGPQIDETKTYSPNYGSAPNRTSTKLAIRTRSAGILARGSAPRSLKIEYSTRELEFVPRNARSNAILRSLGREGNIVKTIPNHTNKPNAPNPEIGSVSQSARSSPALPASQRFRRESHEQTQHVRFPELALFRKILRTQNRELK